MEKLKRASVLVTGGMGLVGSHVVEQLIASGVSVVLTYRSLVPHSYLIVKKLHEKVILVSADVRDQSRIFEIVTKYEIDYIIHLAAQAIVTTGFINPHEAIETNVMGTTNILEAARRYPGVRGVIVASSDKAYGKSPKSYIETDELKGDHPYDVSKSATDLIASAYYKTYKVPVTITRFGNIYGPGDLNENRIIPGILQAMLSGKPLVVRSDGTYVRDYIYVKDVALGYLFLLKHMGETAGEAYNMSTSESLSVLEVIEKAQAILGKKITYKIVNTARNEIPFQHLDTAKISRLGWKPSYTLATALPETYRWYKALTPFIF